MCSIQIHSASAQTAKMMADDIMMFYSEIRGLTLVILRIN